MNCGSVSLQENEYVVQGLTRSDMAKRRGKEKHGKSQKTRLTSPEENQCRVQRKTWKEKLL